MKRQRRQFHPSPSRLLSTSPGRWHQCRRKTPWSSDTSASQRCFAFICHLCSLDHIQGRLVATIDRTYIPLEFFRILRVGMLRSISYRRLRPSCCSIREQSFYQLSNCLHRHSRSRDFLILTKLFILHWRYSWWSGHHNAAAG